MGVISLCYNKIMTNNIEHLAIFDTHTHLNVAEFQGHETEELTLAQEMGVAYHNVVGFDQATIEGALALADQYPNVYATIGWHPTEAGSYSEAVEEAIVSQLSHPKVIALGEIGLDYYWMEDPKEVQIEVFKRQMQLAKDHDLPFVVHTRDALEDTYEVIKAAGVGPRGGIMHSYSGSLEMAERFIELGMMISFSGVVTFKKALDIQEAAQHLPLDKILVETDAPYLAPVPKRGKQNRTAYTRYVVDKIAELRGMTVEEVAKATTANAKRVFKLD
ncbi:TatD family deoxyribonuclease [Streptococcus dysgalactiae]|nr:TatD family deoxyribonuclease [Streptococcus dysgalactiae]TYK93276.1 TatD family deoxyribonuclease [Streptococcus dysgalactiae]TYL05885.1 TatD family deoxyribonuclease [Streptococcus dysgalactiae]